MNFTKTDNYYFVLVEVNFCVKDCKDCKNIEHIILHTSETHLKQS